MARVRIELPAVLASLFGSEVIETDGGPSLATAFAAIRDRHPRLGLHLFDESGSLREHVLVFHNDVNTRWTSDHHAVALEDGDRLTVMQAVSGG